MCLDKSFCRCDWPQLNLLPPSCFSPFIATVPSCTTKPTGLWPKLSQRPVCRLGPTLSFYSSSSLVFLLLCFFIACCCCCCCCCAHLQLTFRFTVYSSPSKATTVGSSLHQFSFIKLTMGKMSGVEFDTIFRIRR